MELSRNYSEEEISQLSSVLEAFHKSLNAETADVARMLAVATIVYAHKCNMSSYELKEIMEDSLEMYYECNWR